MDLGSVGGAVPVEAVSPLQPRNAFRAQYLILASEVAGAGGGALMAGLAVDALAVRAGGTVGTTLGRLSVTIAAVPSLLASLNESASADVLDGALNVSVVFSAPLTPAPGWILLPFAAPWVYPGGAIVVDFCVAELPGAW